METFEPIIDVVPKLTSTTRYLEEPYFTQMLNGTKTIEGRINRGYGAELKEGERLIFFNGLRHFTVEITSKKLYPSFEALLKEDLDKCFPSCGSLEEGIKIYKRVYLESIEKECGVVAFSVKVIDYKICEGKNCEFSATYGHFNEGRRFCAIHTEEGMINLVNC